MLKSRVLLGLVAATLVLSASVFAGDDVDLKDVKCVLKPKGAAKATSSTEYKGHKVYFCCDNCKGKFTADSKKYAASANAQLAATKQAKQVNCPLLGKPVKDGISVQVAGVKVGLCCPGCEKKVNGKEGVEQIELVFNDKAFEKGFELVKNKDQDEN